MWTCVFISLGKYQGRNSFAKYANYVCLYKTLPTSPSYFVILPRAMHELQFLHIFARIIGLSNCSYVRGYGSSFNLHFPDKVAGWAFRGLVGHVSSFLKGLLKCLAHIFKITLLDFLLVIWRSSLWSGHSLCLDFHFLNCVSG